MAIKKVVNINVNGNSMQCRLNSRTDCRFLVKFGSYRLHVELSGIPDGHESVTQHTSHRPEDDMCSRIDILCSDCSVCPQKSPNPYSGAAALRRHLRDNLDRL